MKSIKLLCFLFLYVITINCVAQDSRSQIPKLMQHVYFEVNAGYINYPFSERQLEPGYSLNKVEVPHAAARLVLAGYEFNKYLAAQITYMRPVYWVHYSYKNDLSVFSGQKSVWTNVGGLTLKPQLPLNDLISIYGEGGLGVITRHGFNDPNGNTVVASANFPTFLFGAGVKYKLNNHLSLQICSDYSPASKKYNQPYTSFVGTGFSYKLDKYSEKRLKKGKESGYINPKQWIQIGFSSNVLGYGVNNMLSTKYFPIFWGGHAQVESGITVGYQRNIFHSWKLFAFDLGINTGFWRTDELHQNFFTASVFPVFRLNYYRSKAFDAYFYYSVAGPSFISATELDGHKMGGKFTFQDTMGTGMFFGNKRNMNAEIKIGHYSNGNTFPQNEAVKIPLSLNIGYAF